MQDKNANAVSSTSLKLHFLFIHLFMAALGVHHCAWAFSSCDKHGSLLVAVLGPLTAVASLIAESGL